MIREQALIFLSALVRSFLVNLVQNLWDGLWEEIFIAVAKAESRWDEGGRGEKKKEWVMSEVLSYLDEQANLNFIQRQVARLFVSRVVDAVIETLNESLGKDWVERIRELEGTLADRIPFID